MKQSGRKDYECQREAVFRPESNRSDMSYVLPFELLWLKVIYLCIPFPYNTAARQRYSIVIKKGRVITYVPALRNSLYAIVISCLEEALCVNGICTTLTDSKIICRIRL